VIRQALANAGLGAGEVDAVEGHGTGTRLGDPVEAAAILATYGRDRPAGVPLWLGSIKSNIGHTSAAAGVAGVIKMVMAMRHGVLPRTLHVDAPSPYVEWDAGQVSLLTEAEPWPASGRRPRRAGVSSFGISGTNAHVILEEAPTRVEAPAELAAEAPPAVPVLVSGKGDAALRAQASRVHAHLLARPELGLVDAGFSLATTRAQFERRAAVVASDRDGLLAGLGALIAGAPGPGVFDGRVAAGRTAFLFTGQGAQRAGMGAGLAAAYPRFAEVLDEVCAELDPRLGRSLKELLFAAQGSPEAALLDATEFTQAALFAVEVALFRLVESLGMRPDFLIGHSVGELVAAHVAGVLSLRDACALVAARGRLMGALPAGGGMAAVQAAEDEVAASLETFAGRLVIAAVNGPQATVVSGDLDALEEWLPQWRDRRTSRLRVSHAFHSHRMEPMLAEFRRAAEGLTFSEPRIPVVSNLTGQVVSAELADPGYWVGHVRQAVRFLDGVRTLRGEGVTRFLELGPDAVLTAMARQSVEEDDAVLVPALRARTPEAEAFAGFLGRAHVAGVTVDWAAFYAGSGARRVELPTYAFQREHYWLMPGAGAGDLGAAGLGRLDHPLLDTTVQVADSGGFLLTGRLSRNRTPWLVDHAVAGTVMLPGTAFVELALQAAAVAGAGGVDDLTLQAPLTLPESGLMQLQLSVGAEDEHGRRTLAVHARPADEAGAEWTRHATGLLGPVAPTPAVPPRWPPAGAKPVDLSGAYERLAEAGYGYGPAFRGLVAAWSAGSDRYAEVRLPSLLPADTYAVHPALLDAALHVLVLDAADVGEGLLLPFSWSGVRLAATGTDTLRVRLSRSVDGDVALAVSDGDGRPLGGVAALSLRPAQAAEGTAGGGLQRLDWVRTPLVPASATGRQWAVVGTDPRAATVADAVRADGIGAPLCYELASIADLGTTPEVVLLPYLPDPRAVAEDLPYAVHQGLSELLDAVQQWVIDERGGCRLVVLADPEALVSAPVWGLLRSAAAEHPGRFALADIGDGGPGAWRLLAAALDAGEPQCAVRDGAVLVPRVAAWPGTDGTVPDLTTGTVLVTGGTGGLGALVATHLVERHGVQDVLLTSRHGPAAAGATELVTELERLGATVRVAACDVADRRAVTALLASVPADRPLVGVLHAAGVLDDGTVECMSPERLEAVLQPKVDAGWLLHELTADLPLNAFVLFSSVAGVIGTLGQSSYAAANVFLDALSRHRADLGLPGVSIGWGLWSLPTGMTAGLSAGDLARLSGSGLAVLPPEQGLALLDAALGGTGPVLAARWDLAGLRARAETGGEVPAVLRRLVRPPRPAMPPVGAEPVGTGAAPPASEGGGLVGRLAGLDRVAAAAAVQDLVRTQVAAALGHGSAAAIDVEASFSELGLDSLTGVELRNRLGTETGLRLPATLVFNQPTVVGLSDYLLRELAPAPPAPDQVLQQALDQIAEHLDGADAQPQERRRVVAVLQSAVARLSGTRNGGDPLASLDLASDEEMFQFIDNQL